ncbi:glutamate semialdehyde dehydrogenase [Aspergillus luchuensis]|uniref:glutamate-5-semialdehyde dehydrogenase n=1 Tax=Aspergillus kawachii TaxID=1069201 RepID=A0A146FXJ6_ASPKA|nr:glutamate semialdehyde dehydrogenase [Aspergillus luchuensis]
MSLTQSSAGSIASTASVAARRLAVLSNAERNEALTALYEGLLANKDAILAANAKDVALASRAAEDGDLNSSVLKRLDLSRPGKYDDMLQGILSVRDLTDPSGKESTESFVAISTVISQAISSTRVPKSSIQLVQTRDVVSSLLAQDTLIDLVIPRGSNDLVRFVKDNTKIPVLGHADGLCSAYVHHDADLDVSVKVLVDSKTDYPAACNSLETLLVNEAVLRTILPTVAKALVAKGVTLKCDEPSKGALADTLDSVEMSSIVDAVESDYNTEFLDLILAIKTIPASAPGSGVDAAIDHINTHSSKHTDIILTKSKATADYFMSSIDSAGVFWNASTRFADGMRYGFGTEVGISTNKIHSRGPVGLDGLTIYKYLIRGDGHRAGDYFDGVGGKKWKHEALPL